MRRQPERKQDSRESRLPPNRNQAHFFLSILGGDETPAEERAGSGEMGA
jgi:hypothetical protein